MDAFVFVLAITLAMLGVFLLRDYTRFLSGVYSLPAKVVSIQQVFIPRLLGTQDSTGPSYVSDGFYPIVEYQDGKSRIPFTAIDASVSGRFHVGDSLKLRVSKSRRRMQRNCRSATLLMVLLLGVIGTMLIASLNADFNLSLFEIVAASFELTLVASMLIIFSRERQEQSHTNEVGISDPNTAQLNLYEPTAFAKWSEVFLDKRQRTKIRNVKLVGGCCFTSACLLVLLAFQPALLLS